MIANGEIKKYITVNFGGKIIALKLHAIEWENSLRHEPTNPIKSYDCSEYNWYQPTNFAMAYSYKF